MYNNIIYTILKLYELTMLNQWLLLLNLTAHVLIKKYIKSNIIYIYYNIIGIK